MMKTQWQIYQELEQIPHGTVPSATHKLMSAFYQSQFWQNFLNRRYQNFSYSEKIKHLQQCFQLTHTDLNQAEKFGFFQAMWLILNQPIELPKLFSSPEPYIWTSCNHLGQLIWHIFDPKTGNTLELDSEEQVVVWLEKRQD